MGTEKEEAEKFGDFWQGLGWFLLAFVGLLIIFFFLQPAFFLDWIEPFWDWFGLHNTLRDITTLVLFVYQEYGLFLVFLVIIYFWWVFFTGKNKNSKKEEKPKK
ncbi:hypothetical protein KKE06_00780 [Candidatus Micrarchaeota archaeon]|nr:hypothetical protein [Candidatus Micrarchaeota archaeon]MBU1930141.1 hypothetical protein [Candidatus Micrarchaeota archaeon]